MRRKQVSSAQSAVLSADARTVDRPLYRNEAEVLALVQDLAAPEKIELLLLALRERHARRGLPVPVPAKPIEIAIL